MRTPSLLHCQSRNQVLLHLDLALAAALMFESRVHAVAGNEAAMELKIAKATELGRVGSAANCSWCRPARTRRAASEMPDRHVVQRIVPAGAVPRAATSPSGWLRSVRWWTDGVNRWIG